MTPPPVANDLVPLRLVAQLPHLLGEHAVATEGVGEGRASEQHRGRAGGWVLHVGRGRALIQRAVPSRGRCKGSFRRSFVDFVWSLASGIYEAASAWLRRPWRAMPGRDEQRLVEKDADVEGDRGKDGDGQPPSRGRVCH